MAAQLQKRVGILVSGPNGNVAALIAAAAAYDYPGEIACVIADRVDGMPALIEAAAGGIRQGFVFSKDRPKEDFKRTLHHALIHEFKVDLIALAGYKQLLSADFLNCFPTNVINIHPALLPAFPGLNVHRRVIESGCKITGCTVHLVDEGNGTGPIISQMAVTVHEDDTPETLAARVQEAERATYAPALADFAAGRLALRGRQVLRL